MKKYGDNEKAEVFTGREANVVSEHLQRVAKPISEFSKEEKEALQADLEQVRATENENEEAAKPQAKPRKSAEGKGAVSQADADE